jgi:hypothetical protein
VPELPGEVGVPPLELTEERPKGTNELEEEEIDAQPGQDSRLVAAHRARAQPRPPRAQEASRLRAREAKRAPRAAARSHAQARVCAGPSMASTAWP